MDIAYFEVLLARNVPPQQLQSQSSSSQLEFLCNLDVNSRPSNIRHTSIMCTIGPANRTEEEILEMIEAGMNIAHLQMTHGPQEYQAEIIANIRSAVRQYEAKHHLPYPLAIAIDVKGSEIRTGLLEGGAAAEVELKTGDAIKLTTEKYYMDQCNAQILYIDYENLARMIQPNNRIFIDEGLITLLVTGTKGNNILCLIEHGGILGSCRDCKITGVTLHLPAVTERAKQIITFAVEQNVDFIIALFIRESGNLKDIRNILGEKGKKIHVFSRIDSFQSIENIDAILDASDGILLERGDLGIEIPAEKVFLAQKALFAKANLSGKPVICATHFLQSMIKKPRPTRAEIADIANAIMDGADCLMLSAETAKGHHPVECIKVMAQICKEAEAAVWYSRTFHDLCKSVNPPIDVAHAVGICAVEAAEKCAAKAIIVTTTTGTSAFLVAKYRPRCPIIAITRRHSTARIAKLYRGIIPIVYNNPPKADWAEDVNDRIQYSMKYGIEMGIISPGHAVVVLNGWQQGSGFTNTMRIIFVSNQGDSQE